VSVRVIYDTMIFFQWAALPEDRQHGTVKAIYDGSIRLCMSPALFEEVRDVLSRPEIRAKSPNLTDERLRQLLDAMIDASEWYADVPASFTWPHHPDDDHLFNLAIHARAKYIVTWEQRLLNLLSEKSDAAKQLRMLAPELEIISPKQFVEQLKNI
jgi:putative PIN family toxin of toxin-antitoxin system